MMENKNENLTSAYISLWFVVCVWGTTPLLNKYLLNYFSPSVTLFANSLVSCLVLLLINFKHLKEFNRRSLLIAALTGTFNMTASLVQKIGLQYTTPANYAFLENLSCAVVPFAVWLMVRKKPTKLNLLTVALCLVGAFILAGVDVKGFSLSLGDALCATAGILYGVNIALTGSFSKGCRPSMFILMQMAVSTVLSFGNIFLLDCLQLVPIQCSFSPLPLLGLIGCAIIANAFCWTLRTKAIQVINPTVVAVIMPTSAIIASALSVCVGTDVLTWQLCVGGSIGFLAALLASFDELPGKKLRTRAGK